MHVRKDAIMSSPVPGRFGNRPLTMLVTTLACWSGGGGPVLAAERAIDELVVTATKRASPLQDAAVAVTALDQHGLESAGVRSVLDLQRAVPGMLFSNEQFSLSTLAIRGIGRYAVGTTSDSGTGMHFNGAYLQYTSALEAEFYDVQRVEVLRGPQGTLYGRNTTAGVLNIIAAPPESVFSSTASLELGDPGTRRLGGHLNLPAGERLQLRVAGMRLEQDGFTRNTYSGRRVDDRDLWSLRVAARALLSDETALTLTHQRFEEDDRRMRTSKQYCATDPRPAPFNMGCIPGQAIATPGAVNSLGQLSGLLPALVDLSGGSVPGGLRLLPIEGSAFADAIVPASARRVHADFDPRYGVEESVSTLDLTHQAVQHAFTLIASHQEIDFDARTDLDWTLPSITFTPGIPGLTDADGTLSTPTDPSVSGFNFLRQYDRTSYRARTQTLEARVASEFDDRRWDYLAGAFHMQSNTYDTLYDVHANTLAAFAPTDFYAGAPIAFYRNDAKLYRLETAALFGELYYHLGADTRLTVGARQTREEKRLVDRQTLLNTPGLPEVPGVSNRPFLTGEYAFLSGLGVTDPRFHGFGTASPGAGEFNNPVPSYRRKSQRWTELTGRVGIEHDLQSSYTGRTMLYVNVARSYKSGGINPASLSNAFSETFEPEYINSVELGAKSRLADGRLTLNGAYYFYDYRDLQISKMIDRTSVNENVDARIQGLELELHAAPTPGLRVDASLALMHSRIAGGSSVNPADATNGDARWTAVKNPSGDVFLIPAPGSGGSFSEADCGTRLECAVVFAVNPVSATTPLAAGAETPTVLVPIGVPASLSGNRLPNAPALSMRLGLEYSLRVGRGFELVPRADYAHQARFYYRVFNTRQDVVPSWHVIDLSVTLHAPDARWLARVFVSNVNDADHLTGAFLADAAAGSYTNVFLLDPRTVGARLQYRF
jgi:iron complex outermembrane recepter protein